MKTGRRSGKMDARSTKKVAKCNSAISEGAFSSEDKWEEDGSVKIHIVLIKGGSLD